MKFAEEMAFYTAYHQERRNVLIHVFGVPTISFSVLVPMAWLRIPPEWLGGFDAIPITLATLFTAGVLIYYYMLDFIFAFAATILFGGLLVGAHYAAALGTGIGLAIFFTGQILGWGTQFYGHYIFEGKRPALFDNLKQAIFSAPIFVVADLFFEAGLRLELQNQIKEVLRSQGKLMEAPASTGEQPA